jgi:pilus assembly protein CpaB
MRLSRSTLILVMALAMGALAAVAIHRYIEGLAQDIEARGKAQRLRQVLVPKEDLAKGTPLTTQVVAVRDVPAEWVHSNAVAPEQFDRIENHRLAYPAVRGEALLWSLLEGQRAPSFSSRLSAGRRAITVPVDEVNSISGLLEPGDRIDLVASVRKNERAFLFPLLQDVTVLATGTRAVAEGDARDGRRSFTTITLEARTDDAQRLLAAREVGKLAAVLRAPGDRAIDAAPQRDAMALLGLADPAPDDSAVPVLYGNRAAPREARGPTR